ncbi:MAG TPA: hypothetical protein VEK15_22495 [Vicinamibacteria bacterium]|nr:hypothetical protein [Vicinamibacteria bacterium]
MEHSYEELKMKTVAQLREIAAGIDNEALNGHKTMHKDQLVLALCTALGIDARAHHAVVGIDKSRVKAQIRALKAKRAAALEAKDASELKRVRHNVKRLKQKIKRATV